MSEPKICEATGVHYPDCKCGDCPEKSSTSDDKSEDHHDCEDCEHYREGSWKDFPCFNCTHRNRCRFKQKDEK